MANRAVRLLVVISVVMGLVASLGPGTTMAQTDSREWHSSLYWEHSSTQPHTSHSTSVPLPSEQWPVYKDGIWGYSISHPPDWQVHKTLTNDVHRPYHVIRQRITFEGSNGTEVSIDVWQKEVDVGLMEWVNEYQGRLLQLGEVTIPTAPNAVISGVDALVMSQPGSCTIQNHMLHAVPPGGTGRCWGYDSPGFRAASPWAEHMPSHCVGLRPCLAGEPVRLVR